MIGCYIKNIDIIDLSKEISLKILSGNNSKIGKLTKDLYQPDNLVVAYHRIKYKYISLIFTMNSNVLEVMFINLPNNTIQYISGNEWTPDTLLITSSNLYEMLLDQINSDIRDITFLPKFNIE